MAKSLENLYISLVNHKTRELSYENRINIETRYNKDKWSKSKIARDINVDRSTIYREIDRKRHGNYSAVEAQKKADSNKSKRGAKRKLKTHAELHEYVVSKMKIDWSPEQISIRLPLDYKNNLSMRISHETIYSYIYSQIYRGGNGYVKSGCEDLRMYLPRAHKKRARKGSVRAQKTERVKGLRSIEERSKDVDLRTEIGHWEDDTIVSRANKVRIKSTNERKVGLFFFAKSKDGTARSCDDALVSKLSKIPEEYRKTLTRDRGSENRSFERVEHELKVTCYFAHAYSSWERGSNENGNGLFRRYFPKKTDFDKITDEEIAEVEYRINTRPRKRFGGLTPCEMFLLETGVAIYP